MKYPWTIHLKLNPLYLLIFAIISKIGFSPGKCMVQLEHHIFLYIGITFLDIK